MAAVHRLLVDWDNDGAFANPLADVFGDLKAGSLSAKRGRTYGSQVIAQVSAGTMRFDLRDNANVYNPQNGASKLVGKLAGGQRVRWTIKDTAVGLAETTVWQGYLDEPRVRKHRGEFPEVEMSALGIMQRLEAIQVDVAPFAGITTAVAAAHIAVAAGIDASDYSFAGAYLMGRWSIRRTTALNALRELEEVERGVLFEDRLGRVRLSARGDRLTGGGLAEAIHLSDAGDGIPILGSPQIGYSGRDVVNIAEVEVDTFTSGTSAVLWSIGSPLTVPQKSTLTLIARYPTPSASRDHVGVHSWVPLQAGTDFTATTGLTVSAVARGDELRITLANSTGAGILVAMLQARGVPLLAGDPLVLRLEDTASSSLYGDKDYPRDVRYLSNLNDALDWGNWTLNVHSKPRGYPTVDWSGLEDITRAATIDVGRRVKVTLDTNSEDFFIEGVRYRLRRDGDLVTTYVCSSTRVSGDVLVLNIGPGLGTGALG